MLTNRLPSSFKSMYSPAQFPSKSFKVFCTNLERKEVDAGAGPTFDVSVFAQKLEFVVPLVANNQEGMKNTNIHVQAMARRAAVLFLDVPVFPETAMEESINRDHEEIVMQQNILAAWEQSNPF